VATLSNAEFQSKLHPGELTFKWARGTRALENFPMRS
jgi:hypothetical protein